MYLLLAVEESSPPATLSGIEIGVVLFYPSNDFHFFLVGREDAFLYSQAFDMFQKTEF